MSYNGYRLQKNSDDTLSLIIEDLMLKDVEARGTCGSLFTYHVDDAVIVNLNFDTLSRLLLGKVENIATIAKNEFLMLDLEKRVVGTIRLSSGRTHSSVMTKVWAAKESDARAWANSVKALLAGYKIEGTAVRFHVAFNSKHGMNYAAMQEIVDEVLHDEAYPTFKDFGGVDTLVREFTAGNEPVLILQGKPGTGKTRFIRHVLSKLKLSGLGDQYSDFNDPEESERPAQVLYTSDDKLFEGNELFSTFITSDYEAMVIEDADHLLRTRNDGNKAMHQFLALSDGVIRNAGKKLIFSTNLSNINEIDDALLRPGRCFAWLATRDLTRDESYALIKKIVADGDEQQKALDRLDTSKKGYTVAEIYKAAQVQDTVQRAVSLRNRGEVRVRFQ